MKYININIYISIFHFVTVPFQLLNTTNCFKSVFFISNFCRVLYVVCFLLGNSQASEFYMSTFRNTLSVPSS